MTKHFFVLNRPKELTEQEAEKLDGFKTDFPKIIEAFEKGGPAAWREFWTGITKYKADYDKRHNFMKLFFLTVLGIDLYTGLEHTLGNTSAYLALWVPYIVWGNATLGYAHVTITDFENSPHILTGDQIQTLQDKHHLFISEVDHLTRQVTLVVQQACYPTQLTASDIETMLGLEPDTLETEQVDTWSLKAYF